MAQFQSLRSIAAVVISLFLFPLLLFPCKLLFLVVQALLASPTSYFQFLGCHASFVDVDAAAFVADSHGIVGYVCPAGFAFKSFFPLDKERGRNLFFGHATPSVIHHEFEMLSTVRAGRISDPPVTNTSHTESMRTRQSGRLLSTFA